MIATTKAMSIRRTQIVVMMMFVVSSLIKGVESSSSGQPLAFMNSIPSGSVRNATTKNNLGQQSSKTHDAEITVDSTSLRDDVDPRREIQITKSISVPFSADKAFLAFSDLPRQADFSPWLRKVEYINPPPPGIEVRTPGENWGETRWKMGFRGLSFSWNSICTKLDRPSCIEWESTSGMKNFGQVVFEELGDTNETNVTLTMTFVAPRVVAALFKRSNSLGNFVQNRMIFSTLQNFRDQVAQDEESSE